MPSEATDTMELIETIIEEWQVGEIESEEALVQIVELVKGLE
jgi:hypothetical protein